MVEIKKGRCILRDPRSIKGEVRRFFKELYKQKEVPFIEFEEGLVNRISGDDVALLEVMPLEEEIKLAVWTCDPAKGRGADGFNLNFVRKCWDLGYNWEGFLFLCFGLFYFRYISKKIQYDVGDAHS